MNTHVKALAAQVTIFVAATALSLIAGMLLAAPTYSPSSLFIVTLISGAGFFVAAVVAQRVHDRIIRAGLETIRAGRPGHTATPARSSAPGR